MQVTRSTPLAVGGSLLSVGGLGRDRKAVSTIYLYQCDTREWVKVGELPSPRYYCACATIERRDLLVAGGVMVGGVSKLKSFDIASIS